MDACNCYGALAATRKGPMPKNAAFSTITAETPEIPPNKTQAFTW